MTRTTVQLDQPFTTSTGQPLECGLVHELPPSVSPSDTVEMPSSTTDRRGRPTTSTGARNWFQSTVPTASFCVAGDTNGNALTYNGSSWSSVTHRRQCDHLCLVPNHVVLRRNRRRRLRHDLTDGCLLTTAVTSPGSVLRPLRSLSRNRRLRLLRSQHRGPSRRLFRPRSPSRLLQSTSPYPRRASSITIGSQISRDRRTRRRLTPRAFRLIPDTLTASATNLPITFTPQSNTSYTYPTPLTTPRPGRP